MASIFQYLKGAIGSGNIRFDVQGNTEFQYLKGAIGRSTTRPSTPTGRSNFNTSKVRLEGYVVDETSYYESEFQYLKGAIGSSVGRGVPVAGNAFQYLKGAIGRT